jgi:hypothetical protein
LFAEKKDEARTALKEENLEWKGDSDDRRQFFKKSREDEAGCSIKLHTYLACSSVCSPLTTVGSGVSLVSIRPRKENSREE